MTNTQKEIKKIENAINEKSAQINAIQYALSLVNQKHDSAVDMCQNVPTNIYIEDWKRERDYTQKQAEQLKAIWQQLGGELDELCRHLQALERNKEYEEKLRKEWEEQQKAKESQPKRKGYLYKDTTTNLENNTKQVYFMGVDGYVQDEPKYCTPYKLKKAVENRIQKDINFWGNSSYSEKLDGMSYIEGGKYLHICEIIEIEY